MPESVRRTFDAYRTAEPTWQPGQEGKVALVSWPDRFTYDLGEDPDGSRFEEISRRMLGGRYYPSDTIESFGLWMDEDREIQVGERILQRIRLLPFASWPVLWGMTEVFVAGRTDSSTCTLGYVTTRKHFGKGIWQAILRRVDGRLELEVSATSGPHSWLFWIALPIGRALQRRAWRRAAEEFRQA